MGSTASTSTSTSTSHSEHHQSSMRSVDDVPTDMNGRRPQRGDLIEIFRGSYQHWAVYVGDGSVVHLVVPNFNSITIITQTGSVKEENLRVVVGNDRWRINNTLDRTHEPRPADVIVREARNCVGTRITYHSIRRNCEHFATELRYGVSVSQQVPPGVGDFARAWDTVTDTVTDAVTGTVTGIVTGTVTGIVTGTRAVGGLW